MVLFSGCVQSSTSDITAPCKGEYYLQVSTRQPVINGEQAFSLLKQYSSTFDPNSGMWVHDSIPTTMTASEALEAGILSSGKTIIIDSENRTTVSNVWFEVIPNVWTTFGVG